LRAYTEVRERLVGEMGIDPGPALQELQARILAQDPSLAPASAAAGASDAQAAAPPKAVGNLRERLGHRACGILAVANADLAIGQAG
jgi:DNA-binding SARP family transcriptional activator